MVLNCRPTLGNDQEWDLFVNDHRVLIRSKRDDPKANENAETGCGWTVLSSAVLNGGLQEIPNANCLVVLNTKVPEGYDGVNPNPVELLQQRAQKERDYGATPPAAAISTIGMMTAASMNSLRVATQRATALDGNEQVIVDAIVTAGISNSRAVGADADYFSFNSSKQGTINAIIITNASFWNESTLVEAYAIAVEGKCRATAELGIVCGKNPNHVAQGTGTDSTVLICKGGSGKVRGPLVEYAGKHTLFAELLGQAVFQATKDAILANLQHMYPPRLGGLLSSSLLYHLDCYKRQFVHALNEGHKPIIPSEPMKPVPGPSCWVLGLGLFGVLFSFGIHHYHHNQRNVEASSQLRRSGTVLMAVFFWDRFLGGSFLLPIGFHPVVLIGKLISIFLAAIPESFFFRPLLGFVSGCLLFLGTTLTSLGVTWCVLTCPYVLYKDEDYNSGWWGIALPWFFQVYLMQSCMCLRLLCNIALQMAHFLERGQVHLARDQLSWLCSRDPSNLRSDELAGATLESLSENLSDSFVSPLFWYAVLGPLGALGFKVINTLDSRVGYRGGRYEWVGKPSARVDDLANLLPARLTVTLLMLAAYVISNLFRNARASCRDSPISPTRGWIVAHRDSSRCDSPNAGWPMGCMAGIMNVCLEKRGQYSLNGPKFGGRVPGVEDIRTGHEIAQVAGLIALLCAVILVSIPSVINEPM